MKTILIMLCIILILICAIGLCILIIKDQANAKKELEEQIESYNKAVHAFNDYITKEGKINDWKECEGKLIDKTPGSVIADIVRANNERVQNGATEGDTSAKAGKAAGGNTSE